MSEDQYNWVAMFQAFNASFAALAEVLERAGVIDQDALADEIARFQPADGERSLIAYHAEIIRTLRARTFRDVPLGLTVIDGGREG